MGDQLWMQVLRFGFGRSVSGSTYSEGTFLTQDDERSYWGTIEEVTHKKRKSNSNENANDDVNDEDVIITKTLEIKGSVMFGWGLEPTPIAKFICLLCILQLKCTMI